MQKNLEGEEFYETHKFFFSIHTYKATIVIKYTGQQMSQIIVISRHPVGRNTLLLPPPLFFNSKGLKTTGPKNDL